MLSDLIAWLTTNSIVKARRFMTIFTASNEEVPCALSKYTMLLGVAAEAAVFGYISMDQCHRVEVYNFFRAKPPFSSVSLIIRRLFG
mmetsp:Transcript_3599/g.5224  ORF Transcript_3599/g.5224 Transcript_3599/m.5224 type:complete len:87 (-) Transcript_3599:307-567(-)